MRAQTTGLTVRRTVTVATTPDQAFRVFTTGMDSWWPRTHHIGSSPLKEQVVEPRAGGRCYGLSEDGTECDWGRVLAWDPPRRVVLGWHLDGEWKCDADPAHASEVEVRFVPAANGTRVELVHRNIERHGASAEKLHKGVSAEGGWGMLLQLYVTAAAA